MNRKLHRVLEEIQRTEKKIAEWQEHVKELKLLAEQLENQEIVNTIRSMKLDSHRMLALLEGIQSGTVSLPLPEQEETKERRSTKICMAAWYFQSGRYGNAVICREICKRSF